MVDKQVPPPWEHQIRAVELAKKHKDVAFLMGLGVGKTRCAIDALRYRCNENKKILRTLILGPTAVLFSWRNEIARFSNIPMDKVFVLTGPIASRAQMVKVLPHDTIFITNYECMATAKFAEVFLARPPEFLILDESHYVKGHSALRTKNIIKISDQMQNSPICYRMLLTGTPILNSEIDLFSQFRILDGGKRLGKNFFHFRSNYFEDKNRFMAKAAHFPRWEPKPSTREQLKAKISEISMHVSKEECLTLPPLVKTTVPVSLGTEQARAYKEMKADFLAFCEKGISVAQLALTKALRMSQILSGFMKLDDGSIHRFPTNPRADALRELLEDIAPHHKVIVWGIYQEDYQVVKDICKDLKLPYAELTGLVSDKQTEIDKFQKDETVRVMIASQAAGGTGVTLTAASVMIYYSRGYSLAHDLQSESRAHRGGSEIHKKITRIDLIADGTIDEHVLKALASKKDLSTDILQLANYMRG
jgi:SNF2 family DNA or RNA helicase